MSDLEQARAAARMDAARADKQMTLAAALVATGSEAGRAAIRAAIALDPGDPAILTRGAVLSFDDDDYDGARELLAQAHATGDPEFELAAVLAHLAGSLAVRDCSRAEGLKLLEAAFEQEPWRRAFGYVLSLELLRAQRDDDANGVATRAIAAGAADTELPGLLERISEILAARSSYEDAERAGDSAAAAQAALALGSALDDDDPDGARQAFEQAVQAPDPMTRAMAAINLATVVRDDDPEVAQRMYELALSADDPTLRSAAAFNLGAMLIATDQVRAHALFEIAVESPDPSLIELARTQLALLGVDGHGWQPMISVKPTPELELRRRCPRP